MGKLVGFFLGIKGWTAVFVIIALAAIAGFLGQIKLVKMGAWLLIAAVGVLSFFNEMKGGK